MTRADLVESTTQFSIMRGQKNTNSMFSAEKLDEKYVQKVYTRLDENGRRYRLDNILAPGGRGPIYEWGGMTRAWRYTEEKMKALHRDGRIKLYPDGTAMINAYVRYLDENEGQPVQDWWDDIGVIAAPSRERLGYPTQKPVALLERILRASSNEGDLVLDPFCGCGTTIHAAEKLNRRWIGIDVTHLAIGLIRKRLRDAFPMAQFEVVGVPRDLGGARELAAQDKHQFQLWALSLVEAQPFKGGRKGADGGVDGYIYFKPDGRVVEKAIVSVKGGEHVDVKMIRDLIATVDRERAKAGIFLTLAPPTKPMVTEAAAAGLYAPPHHAKVPKIQIVTIADLLDGRDGPDLPFRDASVFRKARREAGPDRQLGLDV